MNPPFAVHPSSRYKRLSVKLHKGHRDFEAIEKRAAAILSTDPCNRSRQHNIKKLEGVPLGEGPLSVGGDSVIIERVVLLAYCGLRREDTY
jgi:hypothetical protein